ncbi:MAG: HAD family hydrolase [Polyangiaceae bacterium]|jgi:hypothetical protein|nr:HAD family hydrolase [Polyangiaceae bacterium]
MSSKPTLAPEAQHSFLRGVIERVASARHDPRPPVIVFDLDGTLLDNRPRTVAILREVASVWESSRPEASRILASVEVENICYGLADSLAPFGVTDEALVAEAQTHWRDRFFTDPMLRHDRPLAGAVAFAHAVYEAGATLVYLTGRDLPNMSLGSWQSLRDHGFPIGVVGTELVCKPTFEMSDELFKRGQAPLLRRIGQVIASFDNEPGNCNIFLETYPEAASVLLDTQHSTHAPPLLPGVLSIRDFSLG